MEKRAIFIFITTFKNIYINVDNNIIIPQAHKGVPYRNSSSFEQVMGLSRWKESPFL